MLPQTCQGCHAAAQHIRRHKRGCRHCADSDSGEFNLTVTDVASGWLRLYGMVNKAHTWDPGSSENHLRLQPLQNCRVPSETKFPRDNGSEFINRHTINRRETVKTLGLSHSRSCHKNDNCLRNKVSNDYVRVRLDASVHIFWKNKAVYIKEIKTIFDD